MSTTKEQIDVLNLTQKDAIVEAKRCLNCKTPFCIQGCPINNNIPQFIKAVVNEDMTLAYNLLSEKTNLPAICGKICPHEKQCEGSCVLNRKNAPVKIGSIENFIANYAYNNDIIKNVIPKQNLGSVAIIGSGPSGLSCAYILATEGFAVHIYEMEQQAGGILSYGIPSFRLLSSDITREVNKLKTIGVEFTFGAKLGQDIFISELQNKYDAVFISTGANTKKCINIKNENATGVIHANEFLTNYARTKLGDNPSPYLNITSKDKVIVIGGGNVAMDSARTAKRITNDVTVVYRRTLNEMPASTAEYTEAINDNINFMWRHSPVEFIVKNDKLVALKARDLDVDQDIIIHCTIALTAIGSMPIVPDNIQKDDWNCIKINSNPFGMTNIDGVFSAGDVVHGSSTVVLAMREARKTAYSIKNYILSK